MSPQGMVNRDTPFMAVPTAPKREPPRSGHAGFDHVVTVATLAKAWFKTQQLAYTSNDLITLTRMALKAQKELDDAAKRREWEAEHKIEPPKQAEAVTDIRHKPAAARKRVRPAPKQEPTP
jgi:hypothetical protein